MGYRDEERERRTEMRKVRNGECGRDSEVERGRERQRETERERE